MFRFEKDFSLRTYNSFGLDARARYYFELTEEGDFPLFLRSFGLWRKIPLLFLGGGSNILFKSNFEGLIIHANIQGIRVVGEDCDHVWIEAGCGENWDRFVSYCVDKGYGGIENLSLIPGNAGAAPVQNIGAYGVEVKDFVASVRGFDLTTFQFREIAAESCGFAYRNSIFKNQLKDRFLVTSVIFRLDRFPGFMLGYGDLKAEAERPGTVNLQRVREAVVAIRRRKLPDPAVLGNAGSFFKNPVVANDKAGVLKSEFPSVPVYPAGEGKSKVAAAWLIEQCGWKGYRE
ncbi:MAG: UDP-N-acetylmuramate dehydrogenase, partial [Mangrovibacterium sp.]|nr:UDP-N-acetylmuramate dehydrogenase [Mangrovibacterium sp.]